MNEYSGFVSNIKENNENCKFRIRDKDFIYFKNKQTNVFDTETRKIINNKKIVRILFDGLYVSVFFASAGKSEKYSNIIVEDILVDSKQVNVDIWIQEFSAYFKKPQLAIIMNKKNKEISKEPNECVFDYILKQKSIPEKEKVLFKFYKSFYENHTIYTKLKSVVSTYKKPNLIMCKKIKKISESLIKNNITYEEFCKNPFDVMSERMVKNYEPISVLARHFEISTDNIICGVSASILYENYMSDGHVCAPKESFINQVFRKILSDFQKEIPVEYIEEVIGKDKHLKEYNGKILIKTLFFKLLYVSEKIKDYVESYFENEFPEYINKLNSNICEYEKERKLLFNKDQKEAIRQTFQSPSGISLITGLPGSGKTSVVSCIQYICDLLEYDYVLAAPTGKSANKLGPDSFTIHRLLECYQKEGEDTFQFTKNENNPIKTKLIVVDEVSMIDFIMFYNLLKACPKDSIIVLLGDNNQLPSIAYGDVLNSLMDSIIPHTHLSKIYRQGAGSNIPIVSRMIIDRKTPTYEDLCKKDVKILRLTDPKKIQNYVISAYDKNKELQILIPSNNGDVGNKKINELIHNHRYNSELFLGLAQKYNPGEKIICVSNNYERNENGEIDTRKSIFNGDTGVFINYIDCVKKQSRGDGASEEGNNNTTEICTKDGRNLKVPDNIIDYGYSISVHKSQGSEYDEVIFILHDSHQHLLLTNEMLYTAITRAKKKLTIISTMDLLDFCIHNNSKKRYDILSDLLNDGFDFQ